MTENKRQNRKLIMLSLSLIVLAIIMFVVVNYHQHKHQIIQLLNVFKNDTDKRTIDDHVEGSTDTLINDDKSDVTIQKQVIAEIASAQTTRLDSPQDSIRETAQEAQLSNFKSYHNFVIKWFIVITRFLLQKEYSQQIEELQRLDAVSYHTIEATIAHLIEYNEMYLKREIETSDRIFPKQFSIIEKFITIEKSNYHKQQHDILRNKIIDELKALIIFIQSEELLEIYTNK